MNCIINGTITEVFDKVKYENERGKYERQTFILTTTDEYPIPLAITAYGNAKRCLPILKVNSEVIVSFRIKSMESNGRWFTNLDTISVEPLVLESTAIGG